MAIQIKRYGNDQTHTTVSEILSSIGRADDFSIMPDDRIEMIQTINGVTIADGGRYPNGDKYAMTVVFDESTYVKLKTVWANREYVDVVLDDNSTLTGRIIVVKSTTYYDEIMPMYKKVSLEIWKKL